LRGTKYENLRSGLKLIINILKRDAEIAEEEGDIEEALVILLNSIQFVQDIQFILTINEIGICDELSRECTRRLKEYLIRFGGRKNVAQIAGRYISKIMDYTPRLIDIYDRGSLIFEIDISEYYSKLSWFPRNIDEPWALRGECPLMNQIYTRYSMVSEWKYMKRIQKRLRGLLVARYYPEKEAIDKVNKRLDDSGGLCRCILITSNAIRYLARCRMRIVSLYSYSLFYLSFRSNGKLPNRIEDLRHDGLPCFPLDSYGGEIELDIKAEISQGKMRPNIVLMGFDLGN